MKISKHWWLGGLAALMFAGGATLAQGADPAGAPLTTTHHHAKTSALSGSKSHHKLHASTHGKHTSKLHHKGAKTSSLHSKKTSKHHKSTISTKAHHVKASSLHATRISHATHGSESSLDRASTVRPPADSQVPVSTPGYSAAPSMQQGVAPVQGPTAGESLPSGLDANTPAR